MPEKQAKLEQYWIEYQNRLRRFLHSKVSDEAEVEDLLQEILVKFHRHEPAIRSEGSIPSWLFKVAQHAVIDYYRARARAKLPAEESLWFEQDIDTPIWRDMTRCVEPMLNSLPSESAHLLRAVDLKNCSQKQLAEELGLSYSTLKSRVQKARVELRAQFDQCCSFSRDRAGKVADFQLRNCLKFQIRWKIQIYWIQ
ncbi:MAG: RNA polymerase sigma factor SigZ [Granulosicoccaceae bacterium]